MSGAAWMQLAFLLVLLAISTPLLGSYMAKVYGGGRAPADRFFLPIERFVYRLCRIDPQREQRWRSCVFSMLLFSLIGGLLTYLVPPAQASMGLSMVLMCSPGRLGPAAHCRSPGAPRNRERQRVNSAPGPRLYSRENRKRRWL